MDWSARRTQSRVLAWGLACAALAAIGYVGWSGAGRRLTPEQGLQSLEQADQDLLAGRLSEAQRAFQRVATADPNNARAVFGLGLALLRQGRYAAALGALDRAALLEPANTDHAYVRAHTLALSGKREEAIAALETLVNSDPDQLEAAIERIGLLIDAQRWDEARGAAREALARGPGRYTLQILAGRIESHLGAHEAALGYYQRARQLRPYSPQPIYGLIEEYRRLELLDESRALIPIFENLKSRAQDVEKLRTDAASHPADAELAARFIGRLFDDGNLEEGVEQTGTFLAQFPGSAHRAPLALRAAVAASQTGDVPSARHYLQAAQDGPPLSAEQSLASADVFAATGDETRARALYEERLVSAPEDPRALIGIGELSLRSGDLDRAEMMLRRAAKAAPDRADAHALLGLALVQKGDPAAGEAQLKIALDADPLQPEGLFGVGFLAHQRREYEKAEQYLRQALDRRPGYTQARVVLALSLSDQGRCEEAIPLFTRALEIDYSNLTLHAGLVRCLELIGRTAEAARARAIAEKLLDKATPRAP